MHYLRNYEYNFNKKVNDIYKMKSIIYKLI